MVHAEVHTDDNILLARKAVRNFSPPQAQGK
jgi:hypothetical protein